MVLYFEDELSLLPDGQVETLDVVCSKDRSFGRIRAHGKVDWGNGHAGARLQASAHAERRCRQRGTSGRLLSAISDWADNASPIGSGKLAFSLTQAGACAMIAEGYPPQMVDKLRRRALIEADGRAVTVVVGREHRGRRYWRSRGHH